MKTTFIKILSLLLTLCMLLPLAVACKKEPADSTDDDDFTLQFPEVNPDNGFDPVLRFVVTSDLHLRSLKDGADLQSNEHLNMLYETAYAYAASQSYNKLDGIFFAGDFTQNGSDNEMQDFFNYVNANTKEGTTVRAILGNHEFWATGRYTDSSLAATFAKYKKYGGYEEVDQHLVIGGYHFLILNMDRYNDNYVGSKYSPGKLAWLDKELAAAAADDPTGTKPIFIFNHMPATGTVNSADQRSSDDYLGDILKKYPQAVDFAGHTHMPITDPDSVWQKEYTAINTGSLAYLCSYIRNYSKYDQSYVIALNNQGAWAEGDIEKSVRNAGLYYFVEVNAKNEIRLVVSNIFDGKLQAIINIGTVGDPSTFTFTDERKKNGDTPVFADNAKLQLAATYKTGAMLRIPQAYCADSVNNYRVEVYEGTTRRATVYRLSCQYLGTSMPTYVVAPITGLKAGVEYNVKVYAVSTWGVEGEPLTYTFKTATETSLVPDILDIEFNEDGSAKDVLSGSTLLTTGTPTVSMDETLGRNVAILNGSSLYRFNGMPDYYGMMADGFTLESYTYVDAPPSSGYFDTVSNQEGGGFGFEYRADGKIQFYCNVGGKYYNAMATLPTDRWVHLVGVFDGKKLTIYIDGVASDSVDAVGTMKSPGVEAQYLAIGGDSNAGTGSHFMIGKLGSTAIYSEALSASEIMEIYNNSKNP